MLLNLMPPVGSALSDDQIPGVLTYIRGEWGQGGTPVDAGLVKTVRTQTAAREELLAMVKGGK